MGQDMANNTHDNLVGYKIKILNEIVSYICHFSIYFLHNKYSEMFLKWQKEK